MKTMVKMQDPALVLVHEDYNEDHELKVSWFQLKDANIGDVFVPGSSGCGRAVRHEEAKIVFKDEHGVAVLITTLCSTDDPNPEWKDPSVELVWFQFR